MINFDDIWSKNVPYDNIKCHQKSRLHPFSRKHDFWKNQLERRGDQINTTAFLGLLKSQGLSLNFTGTGIRHRCSP